jgi:hypothetical protein
MVHQSLLRATRLGAVLLAVCEHQHFTLTLDCRAKRLQLTPALSGRRETEWYDFCYQGVSAYLCGQPTDQERAELYCGQTVHCRRVNPGSG